MSVLRAAANVAVHGEGDAVYVAPLPLGPIVVLQGTAALIWEASEGADRDRVVATVAAEAGLPPGDVAASVESFLDDLLTRGLLVEE